jgi:hypothetical protein
VGKFNHWGTSDSTFTEKHLVVKLKFPWLMPPELIYSRPNEVESSISNHMGSRSIL